MMTQQTTMKQLPSLEQIETRRPTNGKKTTAATRGAKTPTIERPNSKWRHQRHQARRDYCCSHRICGRSRALASHSADRSGNDDDQLQLLTHGKAGKYSYDNDNIYGKKDVTTHEYDLLEKPGVKVKDKDAALGEVDASIGHNMVNN